MKKSRGPSLTSEDQSEWLAYVKQIQPLRKTERSRRSSSALKTFSMGESRPTSPREKPLPILKENPRASSAPALDQRTQDRLRRGQMPLDGRLDLHGLTQEKAHDVLVRFIQRGAAEGRRCVLVITGKGSGGGSSGVLRHMTPLWLATAPLSPLILSISPAHIKDGGAGAFYVLLKRKRTTSTAGKHLPSAE